MATLMAIDLSRFTLDGSEMHTLVLILNLVVSSASAAWAAVALIRPGSLSRSNKTESGEVFYVRMYAARSIPFGLAAGILPFWFGGVAVAWILVTAAVIQVLDIVIAMARKQRGMAVGAAVGATVHFVCGLAII